MLTMNSPKEQIKKILNNPRALCKLLFKNDKNKPLILTSYQEEIISEILFKKHKRVLCWATTRAGKSLAIALGIILRAVLNNGERIPIIAPTNDHTRIIMNYVIQHILDHEFLISQLAITTEGKTHERLRAEISKQRITFKNNAEIKIISASITQEGRTLIGMGGNFVVIDEVEQIPSEIIRTREMRMLGDSPDSAVFMISNPSKKGYMYDAMKDPIWYQIKVNWKDCVREGRLTEKFVMERKSEMSEMEFQIWYESEYPDDEDDTLIKWKWIEKALNKTIEGEGKVRYGADIAEMGVDLSVLTKISIIGDDFRVDSINSWGKTDTMKTTGKIVTLIDKKDIINVDSTGVGKGVYDRLEELEYNAVEIKGGRSPSNKRTKDRFMNLKAENYWNLRNLFEKGNISIPKHKTLIDQLNKMKYEITSSGKIKIIDPDDKSPDFSDSLCLACINSDNILFYPIS